MSANRLMEKYVPFIPEEQDFCTRAGKIPGDDVIPVGTDICWAYKFVQELPNLSKFPQRICLPLVKLGQYQPGEVLIAKQDGDSVRWGRLTAPTQGVGVPTEFTCVYSAAGDRIRLRWKDPEDVGRYVWRKTRVLRKANSYPANENDGVIVAESTVRDQYYDNELISPIPVNLSKTRWHFKIFAYSADGVVTTSETCQLEPAYPDWGETMSAQIQNGRAANIFHIGDEITVTGSGRTYTFVVNGFDLVESADAEFKRTVALISKTPIVSNLVFDEPHPEYVLVVDEIAPPKGTKVYYEKVGTTYRIKSVATGTHITAGMGIYAKEKDTNAVLYGSNIWATSSSRAMLNGSWLNNLIASDSAFGRMIISTHSPTFDGTIDKVRIPTIDQMDAANVKVTGWSCIPLLNTSYSVYYRDNLGRDRGDYAKEKKNSHVIIHIG